MNDQPVIRDERTVVVENAGYRLAYTVLTFGLLISVVVRALVLRQASWDLLALVIVSSGIATFYQATRRTLSRRYVKEAAVIVLAGAVIGTVTVVILVLLKLHR